ncbi:MAG: MATE family efflux transporter [Ruminococcus bromii]|nr:MATE family efflux transporter [Ruminococcus bromii]
MYYNLTKGSITKGLILFALPMMAGNLLQQFYNIADTLIVGQALGKNALAAVGSAYALMTFLTSVFLGLSMGAGALFSIYLGKDDRNSLKTAVAHAFALIMAVTIIINIIVYIFIDSILVFLQVPNELYDSMREYLVIIFAGLAAAATIIAQYFSGIGILIYALLKCRDFMPQKQHLKYNKKILGEILSLSVLTCAQQSAMNFGILLIQRLVDSFGAVTMAAFAAAVKIDTFAYLPVQDFGNAFSTFIAQNYGAGKSECLKEGFRKATVLSSVFSLVISALVFIFAELLMQIFINPNETAVIASGAEYLRIEGCFYVGIGCLFLLYGFYRAIKCPGMSVILTIVSLGTRVALAYALAPVVGEVGIWTAIPIGWAIADIIGYGYYFIRLKNKKEFNRTVK